MSAATAIPQTDAAARVRLLVLDVDGVLTDGRLYYGPRGEALKVFHVRDGHGIKQLAAAGITVAVISGRRSSMTARRCRELGVRHVVQGVEDKLAAFQRLRGRLGARADACACVGDDMPDVPLMHEVGLAFAVADAHAEARSCRARGHAAGRRARGGARGLRLSPGRAPARAPRSLICRLLALLIIIAVIVALLVLVRAAERATPADDDRQESRLGPGLSARNARLVETGPTGCRCTPSTPPPSASCRTQDQVQLDAGADELRVTPRAQLDGAPPTRASSGRTAGQRAALPAMCTSSGTLAGPRDPRRSTTGPRSRSTFTPRSSSTRGPGAACGGRGSS